jgi:glucose dehydrogenase
MNKTSKVLMLAGLLLLVPFSIALAGSPAHLGQKPSASAVKASLASAPKAFFSRTQYEFDSVFEGTEITHDFVVENKGNAPLIINGIRPD